MDSLPPVCTVEGGKKSVTARVILCLSQDSALRRPPAPRRTQPQTERLLRAKARKLRQWTATTGCPSGRLPKQRCERPTGPHHSRRGEISSWMDYVMVSHVPCRAAAVSRQLYCYCKSGIEYHRLTGYENDAVLPALHSHTHNFLIPSDK